MKESIIANRSFDFAKQVIFIYKKLTTINKEYIMSKQLLKSGTSIGANVREAIRGQTKKDFLAKMCISLKEADETAYWIELLIQTGYVDDKDGESLLKDCKEISNIINSIVKTTKHNLANPK